jgi:HEAT repeat protein
MSLSERTVAARLVALGPSALSVLVPLLDDPDHNVADTAAFAIGCFGADARSAIPALRRALTWNSAWAAHALAMTGDPLAIAALKEAAVAGRTVATPLVLMGAAGQKAFADVLRQTRDPDRFYGQYDLFTIATRVDVSPLATSLIALAADYTSAPANRRMACIMLSEIGGQGASALRALEPLARDPDEGVADRCAYAKGAIESTVARAHDPNTSGPRRLAVAPASATPEEPTEVIDGGRPSAWRRNIAQALGRSFLEARARPLEVAAAAQRVGRVAEIGMTAHGYLTLDSTTLEWPDAHVSGPRRLTAEVFAAVDSAQHVDDANALTSWHWSDAVSTFASVADYTFAVPDVEALVFVAGAIYDDRFLPLFIVNISREVAGRFRWSAVNSKFLDKWLPPEDIGIATTRARDTWKFSMISRSIE